MSGPVTPCGAQGAWGGAGRGLAEDLTAMEVMMVAMSGSSTAKYLTTDWMFSAICLALVTPSEPILMSLRGWGEGGWR